MFESRVQGLGNIRDLMATTTVAEASSEIMMAAVGLDFGCNKINCTSVLND
jgi:hypothetical protein